MLLNESLLRRKLQMKKMYVIILLVYHSFFFSFFVRETRIHAHILSVFASNINPSLPRYLEGCAMYILSIIFFLHTRMSILIYYPNV